MSAFYGHLLRHASGRIGIVLLGGIILLISCPSLVGAYSPDQIDLLALLQPPSWTHPLGTDLFGRDLLSRILYGGRHTLFIGASVVSLAFIFGVVIGSVSGFKGGWIDSIAMRVIDAILSFPALVLAIALSAAMGAGLTSATLAISVTLTPQFARLSRNQARRLSDMLYVDAARALGVPDHTIMLRHILRNGLVPLLTLAPLSVGTAILQVASLGFLGLGAQPPTAEWGADIAMNLDYVRVAPWTVFSTGIAIVLTVLAFNLLADATGAYFSPSQRITSEANRA
ncbi:dipeptide/oligopeptide/nickel ABC transporter permease [Acetobacter malorum DSM 14337]|uniref:Dipeptide/oligopeptide/nickel ABC transporter permease n=1 Tax=Acetobacter malorum DSM 14337 TaxID=1307910 RepID=A0ABQ0PPE2_9PROT|nr:ABC transporter permease [Acetobacter malorum]KXV11074.1 peptide ABC transporter permease [Acetobacter malorum]GBQ77384.1 dipeptide/oligopeptide/nickel ABC transporter permease [Acetobacter malorum DSM 14337]